MSIKLQDVRQIILIVLSCLFTNSYAQFTLKQYGFSVDSNVVYSTDTNYLGYPETCYLHLYKPKADANTKRPILIYVHGGSWLGGSPNDYYPAQICKEFVQRGYVVASIQYRMGMHTNPAIIPGINCPLISGAAQCAYVSDTSEVLRAAFRAMQDTKSAIRFMKARSILDSSCADAVFLAGESAGAITALGAAFMDQASERFNDCGPLPNAPATNANLSFCQSLLNHLPQGQLPNYTRPDLGSIEGNKNLNGYTSRVRAVAAFYGAFFTEALSKNWLNGVDTPAVYLFHQGNDLVVGCGAARPIMAINQCIPFVNLGFNDCVGYSNVPWAYGSCAISSYFQALNFTSYKFDFVNNWTGNALVDCANTAQAGQGHNIDNIALRCDSVAKMFSPLALNSIQNCMFNSTLEHKQNNLLFYPNPTKENLTILLEDNSTIQKLTVRNSLGQVQHSVLFATPILHLNGLSKGAYLLEVQTKNNCYIKKFMVF
ncbi:MAG: T9SS type A sorting domain-containing protein [Bacteroidetes bacterium]|nr:T9SS type A sorting domain-containing protein [Bacteroidota bacterium]